MAINFIQSSFPRGNGVDSAASPKSAPLPGGGPQDAPVAEVDQVRLTPETVRLRQQLEAPEGEAPMDELKIKKLQQAIANGTYRVNSTQLAGKMIDSERGFERAFT